MGEGEDLWWGIAVSLAERIRSGRYPVGSRLPSHAETAVEMDVSRGTARKAADHLRDLGVITPRSGRGLYVAAMPPNPLPRTPDRPGLLEQLRAEFEAYRHETDAELERMQREIAELRSRL